MQRVGSAYAVSAGSLAATASVFGKLGGAASSNSQNPLWRLSCYAGLILCNAGMTTLFVKSLQTLPSLYATVLSVATNICLTGVLGCLLFGEALTARWLIGILLILAGLLLVITACHSSPSQPSKTD